MLIYQSWIKRADLYNNPNVLYLFGDNALRVGLGGQAKEMRGEPNAVGVRTKVRPDMYPDAFLSDSQVNQNLHWFWEDLDRAFAHHAKGGIVVMPLDGLGTGLSELPQRAPQTYEGLLNLIKTGFDL